MSRNFVVLSVFVAFVSLTGCAASTQVTPVTAVARIADPAALAESGVELTDQQVEQLLASYDGNGDGWAYVPPFGPRVVVGNAHLVYESQYVVLEGRVVARITGETIRLTDGRVVTIERLAGGSVRCSVGNVDCSWSAPRGAAIDSGRQMTPNGIMLQLPEPAATALRDAVASR